MALSMLANNCSFKFRLYLIFVLAFLIMHFTGVLLSRLPYILNALISSAVVLSVLLTLQKWSSGNSFNNTIREIGFQKARFKTILPGILIAAILLGCYPVLGYAIHTKIVLAENWLLNSAGIFLTGGLTEEALFRGYLFGQLRRTRSFLNAALISAFFFSLVHLLLFAYFDWPVALLSTLLAITNSIPFAYLFEKTGNTIWASAIVHATIRTIGMVLTTDTNHSTALAMLWITASMIVPYLVLIFYKDFRSIWKQQPAKS